MYLQQRNNDGSKTQPSMRAPTLVQMPPPMKSFYTPPHMTSSPPMHRPMLMPPQPFKFAQPQNNNQFRYNTVPQNQAPFRMPTRTQQMFAAPPPNYNARSNTFRLPPRNQPQNFGPRPMSGVQSFTPKVLPPTAPVYRLSGHDWSKHGNPPPSNYFKTREMNLNECYNDAYVDYYCEPDSNYYSDFYEYPAYTSDYVNYADYEHYGPDPAQVYEVPNVHDAPIEPQPSANYQENFQKTSGSDKPK